MPHPGDVFYLPPEASESFDKGDRPHVLLSLFDPRTPVATLAYGSTKSTDALHGAEYVLIDPTATAYRGTGLKRPTYVYTSRLVGFDRNAVGRCSGRIIDEMPEIRASLARALGIGRGVTGEVNTRRSNRRGRLVELAPDLAADWDVRYAVVITGPEYSRTGFQQTLVPLLDGECEAWDLDVVIRDASWLAPLGKRYGTAILATSMASTVYLPSHIARFLDIVMPSRIMAEVDSALRLHFGL